MPFLLQFDSQSCNKLLLRLNLWFQFLKFSTLKLLSPDFYFFLIPLRILILHSDNRLNFALEILKLLSYPFNLTFCFRVPLCSLLYWQLLQFRGKFLLPLQRVQDHIIDLRLDGLVTIYPGLYAIASEGNLGDLILHIHELLLPEHAFLDGVHPLILLVLIV